MACNKNVNIDKEKEPLEPVIEEQKQDKENQEIGDKQEQEEDKNEDAIKEVEKEDPQAGLEVPHKKIEKKGYVTTNGLNVRTAYSTKGEIITKIHRGSEVHVYGETNNWYKVRYAKNKEGWVHSKYIQFDPISKPQAKPESKPESKPNPSDQLNNKVYNWYFNRKSDHSQPTFGSPHKSLIDKYNGIAIGSKNSKDIYLTLDNGYENGNTSKILDVLQANGVKVGFFVQGTYIDKNPAIVKRMVNEGHLVLNHTDNHPSLPGVTKEKLQEEIKSVENKYKNLTGKDMVKFLRPPSGTFSERSLALTKDMGYTTVFWSMAHRDWLTNDQPGKQVAYEHVIDNIHNGAIILLHSVSQSNTEALDDIIKELKSQGYQFRLLTEFH